MHSLASLRCASCEGAVEPSILPGSCNGKGVRFLASTMSALRDDELWAFHIGRDFVMARGRVFCAFLARARGLW